MTPSTTIARPDQIDEASATPRPRWTSFLTPSVSDAVLIALLGWLLLHTFTGGTTGLLFDSSAGLHIRYGDLQRAEGHIPQGEPLSYSSPHISLVRWEWLAENLYSRIHQAFGLRGIILLAAALIVGAIAIVLRRMAATGADALVVIVLVHLGVAVSSVHFLARPLTFTLFFFALSLWIIERNRQLWALPLLTALWANLHGGYVGLLVVLAILAAGSAMETKWLAAGKYALLTLACAAASLVNPYGWKLPWSEIEYLRADWPRGFVYEYRAPNFGSVEGLYLGILLAAGLLTAVSLVRRKQYAQALLIAVWAEAAVTSIRHAPIFFLVAAPAVAAETQRLWAGFTRTASRKSFTGIFRDIGREHAPQFRRNSIWPAVVAVALLFSGPILPWPKDFPASRNPVDLVQRYQRLLTSTRTFTTDDWSSYLTYHDFPQFRYFLGAFVNAGHQAVTAEYVQVMNAAPGWENVLARYQVNTLLVPSESIIGIRAHTSPGWEVLEDNGMAVVAKRR